MKAFLRGIFTTWLTFLLIGLGLVLSLKGILVDTADTFIKKEITNNVVKTIENYNDEKISEEVITKVKDTIENNKEVKKIVNTYFDKIVAALSDKEANIKIDVTEDLNSIIDAGEQILKDNGVTITEAQKQKLLNSVSTDEVNYLVNEVVTEAKQSITPETKVVLDAYNFLTGQTLRLIIIALIGITLLLIALLKKSIYKWLSNFGVAAIISGTVVGILLPLLVNTILDTFLKDSNMTISIKSLNNYGYILIALGVISIILKIVISMVITGNKIGKKLDRDNKKEDLEKTQEYDANIVSEVNDDNMINENSDFDFELPTEEENDIQDI